MDSEAPKSPIKDTSPAKEAPLIVKIDIPKFRTQQLAIIHSMWQFSACCQFLYMFQEVVDIHSFDSLELEEALITPSNDWLLEFMVRFLRVATKNRFIMEDTWLEYLPKELEKRNVNIAINSDYFHLDIRTRVLILHFICELQLERPDQFKIVLDTPEIMAAKSWRIEPIGTDSKGNIYWLFDDSRLYQENKQNWSLVCSTQDEWVDFAKRFENSTSTLEKKLYKYISASLLPLIIRDLEAQEHARIEKKKLFEELRIAREKEELLLAIKEAEEKEALERKEKMKVQPKVIIDYPPGVRTRRSVMIPQVVETKVPEVLFINQTRESRIKDRETKKLLSQVYQYEAPRKKTKYQEYSEDEFTDEEAEEDFDADKLDISPKTEKEEWLFRCTCGAEGKNYDDGTPIIVCEKCNIWQHINCITKDNLDDIEEKDFICDSCKGDFWFYLDKIEDSFIADTDILVEKVDGNDNSPPPNIKNGQISPLNGNAGSESLVKSSLSYTFSGNERIGKDTKEYLIQSPTMKGVASPDKSNAFSNP